MAKQITFTDSEQDKKLVERIQRYQREKELPHFITAVRQLCKIGLDFKELSER